MAEPAKTYCNDYGDAPDCLGEVDPAYDMDYTDVEPGAVFRWCRVCGERARAWSELITKTCETREGFEKLDAAVTRAQEEARHRGH